MDTSLAIPSLSIATIAFSATVVLVAYTVRGIAGFGSGLIAIPLLSLSFPLTLVVPLVVALDFLGSAGQGLKNRRLVSWRDLAPLLPFTILGMVSALYLLDALDPTWLRRALGTFVLVYGTYQLLSLPTLAVTRLSSLPYGFLGGLVGTLFGTGGPFYIMYLSMRGLDKGALRASFAVWFLIYATLLLAGYATFGFLNEQTLISFSVALPVAVAGLLIGGRIHTRLTQATFKRMISVLLILSGTGLLFKS